MAFLSGYSKRKLAHWVNNNLLVADYQITINPKKTTGSDSGEDVYLGSNVQDDFDDIRLTKGDGQTLLDQWRESYTSGTEARYWGEIHKVGSSLLTGNAASGQKDVVVSDDAVFAANDCVLLIDDSHSEICKIASINTGTNTLTMLDNLTNAYTTAANAKVCHCAYLYYKNDDASLLSDGDDTFLFFDHFDGDLSKWTGDTSAAAIASSICTLTATTTAYKVIHGTYGSAGDIVLRSRVKLKDANYSQFGLTDSPLNDDFIIVYHNSAAGVDHSEWTHQYAASHQSILHIGSINFGSYDIHELHRIISGTDTVRYYLNDALLGSYTTNVPDDTLYPCLRDYGTDVTTDCDWILIRKGAATESTWGAWGAEETGVTAKTSSDSGSGSDSSSLAASHSRSDSGAGSDAKADYPSVTHSRSENGSGAESSSETAAHARSDSGMGSEISALLSAILGTDNGAGAETILSRAIALAEAAVGLESILSREVAGNDSGIGADFAALVKTILGTDSGVGSENSYLKILEGVKTSSDSGSGAESSALSVEHLRSETGSGVDAIIARALWAKEYPAGAIDLVKTITATLQGQDTGVGAELSLMAYLQKASDSGVGRDTAFLTALFSSGDFGAGAEAITLAAAIAAQDAGVSVESVLSFFKQAFDNGVGAESMSLIGAVGRAMKMITYLMAYRDLKVYTRPYHDLKVYTAEVKS